MKEFEISSANPPVKLKFFDFDGDNFSICFTGQGIRLDLKVYAPNNLGSDDPTAMVALFKSMKDQIKGWNGELNWKSIEGHLEIIATSDSLGHTKINLIFWDYSNDWSAKAEINLDSMQVEKAYQNVAQFFSG